MPPRAKRRARGTSLSDFLISLSGASPQILRRCPTERPKYTGIGSAILVTALIAAMSAAFVLCLDVGLPLAWAILLGMALGLTIIALDRWLIAALDRQSNPWRYLILAAPRIALGVILGVALTTPLLLQIFVSYINGQLAEVHSSQLSAYYVQLPSTALNHKITSDENTVNYLEKVIDSDGATAAANPYKDPELLSLEAQLTSANSLAASDYKLWSCQLYGGPSCPNAIGDGPLAEADHSAYNSAVQQVKTLQAEIESREAQLNQQNVNDRKSSLAQAQAAFPAAQSRLAADTAEQTQITTAFQRAVSNNNGLLPRLQALSEVTQGASTINTVRWLLFALFVLIQCFPIGVKVLLNLGPENTYEKMVALEEEGLLRAAREDVARRQAIRDLG